MNSFGNFGQQLKQVWEGMSPKRRAFMATVFVVGISVVLGVGYFASRTDYQVLFSGLAPEDAAAVTGKLQSKSIPYRLDAGGTTILIPADKVSLARIELAAEGMPSKGGKGLEIFDEPSLGATPFTQQVNYIRAIQSELARTIMQVEPITFARVHIVRPESTPFIRERKPATASIVLRFRPGTTLSRTVAQGIAALVSRSVEGLARENVTIVDTNGRTLSDEVDPDTGPVTSHLEHRQKLENHLSTRAEMMLAKVVGPGRAIVRVSAEVNFQRIREKKETYDADSKVPKKETILSTKSTGGPGNKGGGGGGAAGTGGNVGKEKNLGGGGSSSSEEKVETEFGYSKTIKELEDNNGSIERLTVATLIDLSSVEAGGMDIKQAEEIVKQAVGFKVGRDEIKISNVPLKTIIDEPIPEPENTSEQTWQNVLTLVRYVSLGLAALAALSIGFMVYKSRQNRIAAEAAKADEAAKAAEALRLAEANDPLRSLSLAAEQNPDVLVAILDRWLQTPEAPRQAAA